VVAVSAATEEARRDADVASAVARERQELMRRTTFCSLVFPPPENKPSAKPAADADERADTAAGKAKQSSSIERVPLCGDEGLFRFADSLDVFLYVVSFIGAAIHGAALPAFALIFGQLIDSLNNPDPAALSSRIDEISVWFVYIGLGALVFAFLEVGMATIAAERQAARIRETYMRALLRQEMAYYDQHDPGEVASRLTEDTILIVNGVGEKLANAIQFLSSFLIGLAVGFSQGWDLTLVVVAFVPLLALPMVILKTAKEVLEKLNGDAFARASAAASEAISNIRTVMAFGGQAAESRRFDKQLDLAELVTVRGGRVVGMALGIFWLSILGSYAAAFAYGASRIRASREENPACIFAITATGQFADCYTAGNLMSTFFAVLIGAMSLGQAVPNLAALGSAQAAAHNIFSIISRKSTIDPTSGSADGAAAAASAEAGPRPMGRVEFRSVSFAYPSDKSKRVLDGFSAVVERGQTLALVGESGSGKSTIVQLLMRFYDTDEGTILLDGKDIREYDVAWLRAQIGLVSQEPSLFSTSIEENIALGLPSYTSNFGEVSEGTVSAEDLSASDEASKAAIQTGSGVVWGVEVSDGRTVDGVAALSAGMHKRVVEAAKAASVDGFARALPKGYRTQVGDRGGQLSGGQKQRVAIARALIRKPAIFIGDEATSALDSQSEKQVTRAMARLLSGPGRDLTSILVAHRLSTITSADKIIVLAKGKVIETGDHASLMEERGVYFSLASGQGIAATLAKPAGDASDDEDEAAADAEGVDVDASKAAGPRARSASAGSDGVTARQADKSDDLSVIEQRVARALSRGAARHPLDRLFFAVLDKSTSPPDAAAPAPDAGSDAILARSEPRVVLLQSSFLELALSEKRALLSWWLGQTAAEIDALEADVAARPDAGLAAALAAVSDKAAPRVLPESAAMARKAVDNKTAVWDALPEVDAATRTLYLPPARSRNKLLQGLLLASRPPAPMSKTWGFYDSADVPIIIGAIIASVADGCVFPVYALVLAEMLAVLYKVGDEFEEGVLTYSLAFLAIGVCAMVATWLRVALFELLGARLTTRLRKATYSALLRQEVAFFDYDFNSQGVLAGRLASDAALVRATTGERIGLNMANASSLLAGLIIAFTASWRLSLVMIGIIPLLFLSGYIQMKTMTGFAQSSKQALESSAAIASEAMVGIRTVTGLGLQRHVGAAFSRSLEGPRRNAFAAGLTGGFALGLSQAILFCAGYSLVFWAGSRFIAEGLIDFAAVSKVFFAITFAAQGMAQASSLAGDAAKADAATRSIFALVERTPRIGGDDSTPPSDAAPADGKPTGRVEFKNVTFSYPARPDALALRDFSAEVGAGDTVGLVGPSGSGKSTIVQLLMRFYDPDEGTILLDGKDLREYDVSELRGRMGLVGQEPALFSDTVHYNIAYGRRGGIENKPMPDLGLDTETDPAVAECRPQVEEAAMAASAHEFITKRLPLGYTTFAGMQGSSRLSGGQKQRVAIARALIRKPAIFIGDEATSALDTQSEKEVQRALDEMLAESKRRSLNRTSLFVAHRLSTIRDADKIVVLEDGRLVEEGTHTALMARGNLYAGLARAQQMVHGGEVSEPAAAGAAAPDSSE